MSEKEIVTRDFIEASVAEAIKSTINKFRENPYYFFTESDIHSYFYHSLYSSRLERSNGGERIYLVHREYPTNFRYKKATIKYEAQPYPLSGKKGDRGNYDIAVLDPDFAKEQPIDDVINKDVTRLKSRVKANENAVKNELLFAIEFKYVIKSETSFIELIREDNKKLLWATEQQAMHAINLVFCKAKDRDQEILKATCTEASDRIISFFIQAFFGKDGAKKTTPKPENNHSSDNFLKQL